MIHSARLATGLHTAFLLFALQIMAFPCHAEPVTLKNEIYDLGQSLKFLEDPDKSFTLDDIRSPKFAAQFKPSLQQPANFSITTSAYWVCVELHPLVQQSWLLEISSPRLDRIDLYSVTPEGQELHKITGLMFPFKEREVAHQNFTFRLPLKQGVTSTFYMRVESSDAIFLPVRLWPEGEFAAHEGGQQLGLGMYYGLLFVMGIVNLLVFFAIKDRSNLYFALFLFSFTIVLLELAGLSDRFLFGNMTWWAKQSLPFFEGFSAFWAILFTRSFLQTEKHLPKVHNILSSLIVPALLIVLLALIVDYRWSIMGMIVLSIGAAVIIQVAVIMCWQKGFRPARFFLIAWAVFLFGTVIYALAAVGLLTFNVFTNNILQIGVAWMAVLMSLALTDRFNMLEQEKRKAQLAIIDEQKKTMDVQRTMMEAISRFVPRQFLSFLERDDIVAVKLGDAVLKDMAVLFTDIRGFTSLSEGMTPDENFQFINTYLEFVEPSVDAHDGFVDKFIGDAIMALFPDGADKAIAAAIDMRKRLGDFNRHQAEQGLKTIDTGIGIHCGDLMLGTVGSKQRLDTTVIGDNVNLASRLEGLNKPFGTSIIISESVYKVLLDPEVYCLRQIGMVQVRGKNIPVTIHEVFDADPAAIKEKKFATKASLQQALAYIKGEDYKKARPLLKKCLSIYPEDKAAQKLLEQCQP